MQKDKNVMSFEPVLPPDFDGIFRFTNASDEDFIGQWGKKDYLFPAQATTPMIMPDHSPLEIQNIRKKFAKDWAEREFYKSKGYKVLAGQEGKPGNRTLNSIHQAAGYTLSDLEPYIQQCLKPLKEAQIRARPTAAVPLEDKLSKTEDGELRTEAIDQKTSLRQKALNA